MRRAGRAPRRARSRRRMRPARRPSKRERVQRLAELAREATAPGARAPRPRLDEQRARPSGHPQLAHDLDHRGAASGPWPRISACLPWPGGTTRRSFSSRASGRSGVRRLDRLRARAQLRRHRRVARQVDALEHAHHGGQRQRRRRRGRRAPPARSARGRPPPTGPSARSRPAGRARTPRGCRPGSCPSRPTRCRTRSGRSRRPRPPRPRTASTIAAAVACGSHSSPSVTRGCRGRRRSRASRGSAPRPRPGPSVSTVTSPPCCSTSRTASSTPHSSCGLIVKPRWRVSSACSSAVSTILPPVSGTRLTQTRILMPGPRRPPSRARCRGRRAASSRRTATVTG